MACKPQPAPGSTDWLLAALAAAMARDPDAFRAFVAIRAA